MNIQIKNLWKKNASEIIDILSKREVSALEVLDSFSVLTPPTDTSEQLHWPSASPAHHMWLRRILQRGPLKAKVHAADLDSKSLFGITTK